MGRGRRSVLGAAAGGAAALVGSYLAVTGGRAARLDRAASVLVSRPLGATADRAVGIATDLGSVYGIGGVSAALFATGHRRLAVDVAGAGGLAWCAAQAAKPLLPRERPYQSDGAARLVAHPAGTSWPSGHAAVAAAMAWTLADVLPSPARRVAAGVVAGVGVSRLYVGVHHLSDVVAGYGTGLLAATLWRAVRRRR